MDNDLVFKEKYLKYKTKYIELKDQLGGVSLPRGRWFIFFVTGKNKMIKDWKKKAQNSITNHKKNLFDGNKLLDDIIKNKSYGYTFKDDAKNDNKLDHDLLLIGHSKSDVSKGKKGKKGGAIDENMFDFSNNTLNDINNEIVNQINFELDNSENYSDYASILEGAGPRQPVIKVTPADIKSGSTSDDELMKVLLKKINKVNKPLIDTIIVYVNNESGVHYRAQHYFEVTYIDGKATDPAIETDIVYPSALV